MPDKLIKNVAIARSGVYKYLPEELPNLGLSATPPAQYRGRGFFGVYRPATVLARAADKFVRLPLTLEHPNEMVDGTNFKKYAVGFTGDSAYVDMTPNKKEVIIKSSLTMIDNAVVRAYYSHVTEVSPGYTADFGWEEGVAPSGEDYQIVMRELTSVNHLALTRHGRGGSAACILDHRGVLSMRKSGLIYAVRKLLGVKDTAKPFSEQVDELIKDRGKLSDEEVVKRVNLLRDSIVDLPESDDRAKLDRFIEDMDRIKEESDEAATKIGEIVTGLYKVLDARAVQDVAYHKEVKPYGCNSPTDVASQTELKKPMPEKGEATDEMEKGAKMPGLTNEKHKEPDDTKSAVDDEKETSEGDEKIKGEMSRGNEEGKEKSEISKIDTREKKGEYGEEKSENEKAENEKEHKRSTTFHERDKDQGETIDSLVDKVVKGVLAKLAEKEKKPEVVTDSAIKKVMEGFKTPSLASRSTTKVDDTAKSTGVIANTMKVLKGGK
jgi:hypothetical protein